MTKYIVGSLFALFYFLGIQSQENTAIITYTATLNNNNEINRLIIDSVTPTDIKNKRISMASSKEPVNFILLVKGNKSCYKAEIGMDKKRQMKSEFNMTSVISREQNKYYTNLQTNESFFQSYFNSDILVDLGTVKWKITGEKKKIGKYICFKALSIIDSKQTFGMEHKLPVEAWYTPEIPISFGIQKFNGLPGLMLELTTAYESGTVFYEATKIELNPEKNIEIQFPQKKKHISESEYVEMIEKLNTKRAIDRL